MTADARSRFGVVGASVFEARARLVRLALILAVALGLSGVAAPQARAQSETRGDHLYRTLLVRAAPGQRAELIELWREYRGVLEEAGDAGFHWMRHSQGDQWDLMLLFPMGSFGEYYAPERVEARRMGVGSSGRTGAELQDAMAGITSWRSEVFAHGPSPEVVAERWEDTGLFHVEMFVALPGLRDELVEEREMENVYLEETGRAPNLIFERVAGAAWDSYTIGFYPDLVAYAQGAASVSEEEAEAAARKAGFESASVIGDYLRRFLLEHHDTLAVRP